MVYNILHRFVDFLYDTKKMKRAILDGEQIQWWLWHHSANVLTVTQLCPCR